MERQLLISSPQWPVIGSKGKLKARSQRSQIEEYQVQLQLKGGQVVEKALQESGHDLKLFSIQELF